VSTPIPFKVEYDVAMRAGTTLLFSAGMLLLSSACSGDGLSSVEIEATIDARAKAAAEIFAQATVDVRYS